MFPLPVTALPTAKTPSSPSSSPVWASLIRKTSPCIGMSSSGSGMLPTELMTSRDGTSSTVPSRGTTRPSRTAVAASRRPPKRSPSVR